MNVGERTTTSPIVVVGNLRCVTFSPNIFLSLSPLTKRFLIRNNLFIFWLLKCFVFLPSWLLFVFNGIFFCHSIRWPFEVILEESRIFLGFTRLAGKDIILQVVLCWIIARKIRILRDLDIQIKNRIHSTDWRWRNDSGSCFCPPISKWNLVIIAKCCFKKGERVCNVCLCNFQTIGWDESIAADVFVLMNELLTHAPLRFTRREPSDRKHKRKEDGIQENHHHHHNY